MTDKTPLATRRSKLGQAFIPLALLALVALVGGLVLHARSMEASHRATAESALRDYAAFAAWQYTEQAANFVGSTALITLNIAQKHFRAFDSASPLPHPEKLVSLGDPNACGLGSTARFSFRLDLPGRELTFDGEAPDLRVREALAERFASLAGNAPQPEEVVRMFVDTLAGEPRVIAYGIVRGADSIPRAVYGVEAPPGMLVDYLEEIPATKELLPPSLVGGIPVDSLLMIQVRRADGGVFASFGSAADLRLAAQETTSREGGSLTVTVVLRPEAAAALLIGGVPGSNLGMLVLLLLGSIALAGVAMVQIRRGRELSRLRTRFVANVSHELRTPLAQISMFSETLLLGRERSHDEGREFLSVIFREARRLSQLVESVLSFSRAEAGPRAFHLERRDVACEVSDAVRSFSPLAAAAGVELRTRLGEECAAMVEAGALRQIVLNLLDNAVKFGPKGQRVTASVARAGSEIVVSVDDQGPGIPPAERRRVFDAFVQGKESQSRTATGAGIGLAVVAELVAAHGGRVWVDDAPGGRGTRVSLALAALDDPAPEPPLAEVAEPLEELAAR